MCIGELDNTRAHDSRHAALLLTAHSFCSVVQWRFRSLSLAVLPLRFKFFFTAHTRTLARVSVFVFVGRRRQQWAFSVKVNTFVVFLFPHDDGDCDCDSDGDCERVHAYEVAFVCWLVCYWIICCCTHTHTHTHTSHLLGVKQWVTRAQPDVCGSFHAVDLVVRSKWVSVVCASCFGNTHIHAHIHKYLQKHSNYLQRRKGKAMGEKKAVLFPLCANLPQCASVVVVLSLSLSFCYARTKTSNTLSGKRYPPPLASNSSGTLT